MENQQAYDLLHQHIQDILNTIIDVRKAYSGGGMNVKKENYITFRNDSGDIIDKIDEIKEKAQESLHLMFLIDNREESK